MKQDMSKIGTRKLTGWHRNPGLLLGWFGWAASAAMAQSGAAGSQAAVPQEQILRTIDDPHSGDQWTLVHEASHPGGPGRLVRVAGPVTDLRDARTAAPPVIRAGDRLLVEQHTPQMDAWLEAVALGPAAAGAMVNVRIQAGGRVVRVAVLGPGQALLPAVPEARR